MTNRLSVWWEDRISGCLYLGPDGETLFAYDADWLADSKAPALSFSLPKQAEPFKRSAVQAFFGGILPEEGQRTAIARALGVSADNEFRLLEYLGGEVAGAPTLLPEGQTHASPSDAAPKLLDDDALVQLLDHLPLRPMLAGEDGLRLSLAGAQLGWMLRLLKCAALRTGLSCSSLAMTVQLVQTEALAVSIRKTLRKPLVFLRTANMPAKAGPSSQTVLRCCAAQQRAPRAKF
jgi:HipA-like protein